MGERAVKELTEVVNFIDGRGEETVMQQQYFKQKATTYFKELFGLLTQREKKARVGALEGKE